MQRLWEGLFTISRFPHSAFILRPTVSASGAELLTYQPMFSLYYNVSHYNVILLLWMLMWNPETTATTAKPGEFRSREKQFIANVNRGGVVPHVFLAIMFLQTTISHYCVVYINHVTCFNTMILEITRLFKSYRYSRRFINIHNLAIAQIAPLSFQGSHRTQTQTSEVRWLHASVVTEWSPACLHKQFQGYLHRGN